MYSCSIGSSDSERTLFAALADRQGRLQRSAQGLRREGAALRGLQGPPAQQGLEGREEGQLHKACPARVRHPQVARPSAHRQALRRVRDRHQLVLHRARVLRGQRPRLLPQAAQDHTREGVALNHHADSERPALPQHQHSATRHPLRPQARQHSAGHGRAQRRDQDHRLRPEQADGRGQLRSRLRHGPDLAGRRYLLVLAARGLCAGTQSAQDLLQGRRLECWLHILSVHLRTKGNTRKVSNGFWLFSNQNNML